MSPFATKTAVSHLNSTAIDPDEDRDEPEDTINVVVDLTSENGRASHVYIAVRNQHHHFYKLFLRRSAKQGAKEGQTGC